jgi:hypothetical protein
MHRARAFFFVCAGIFLLAAACLFITERVAAQTSGQFRVVGASENPGYGAVLYVVAGGTLYGLSQGGWQAVGAPVPADQIAWFEGNALVSTTGEGWVYYNTNEGGLQWYNKGAVSGVTAAQSISIGQLKAKYATPAGK